jgi:hypothetical protein
LRKEVGVGVDQSHESRAKRADAISLCPGALASRPFKPRRRCIRPGTLSAP